MRTHPRLRRKSFLQRALAPALALLCMAGIGATTTGCKRTPVTDRVQYNVIPDDVLIPLGVDSYKQMLQGERVVTDSDAARSLNQVGRRISKVANEPDYRWEYRLVKD